MITGKKKNGTWCSRNKKKGGLCKKNISTIFSIASISEDINIFDKNDTLVVFI